MCPCVANQLLSALCTRPRPPVSYFSLQHLVKVVLKEEDVCFVKAEVGAYVRSLTACFACRARCTALLWTPSSRCSSSSSTRRSVVGRSRMGGSVLAHPLPCLISSSWRATRARWRRFARHCLRRQVRERGCGRGAGAGIPPTDRCFVCAQSTRRLRQRTPPTRASAWAKRLVCVCVFGWIGGKFRTRS